MDLTNKKILVTGADGFIGSHLTEALVTMGLTVRALVCYNSFNSWGWLDTSPPRVKRNLEVVSGDIRDPYGVREAMLGCDVVFHLAALIAIPYSYRSPATYVDTNIHGTLNVVQAARDLGIERVIHTSTSEVYGTAQFVPITEEHPLSGQSPYSASKIGADQIALSYFLSFGTPVSVIRPFNTYGPRQSARAVIPTLITQMAGGRSPVKLGALSPTRDFNHVKDMVQGFIATAKADRAVGEVINFGTGFEISIEDLAHLTAEVMGREIEITCESERMRPEKSEVERLLADNSKAARLTGWKPAYAGLDGLKRGIEETAEWYLVPENLEGFKSQIYNV